MADDIASTSFLKAAEAWVCDGYSIDVRYLAERKKGETQLWSASILLNPLKAQRDLSFSIESPGFVIGQSQRAAQTKKALLKVLERAVLGIVDTPSAIAQLPNLQPHGFFSEMSYRERWFSDLHLQIDGSRIPLSHPTQLVEMDNKLRASEPPFDGLADAANWLGLSVPGVTSSPPSIVIRVGPPCDLIFEGCILSKDKLQLVLHAHPKFDISTVGLAVRAVPGDALNARRQIATDIKWGRAQGGRRVGKVNVSLKQADNALVMLLIGNQTVRRQWFTDPAKAQNKRLLAVQHFDQDLRMIKQAVFDASESAKFEQGIAALCFLLGFCAALQLETDAPDIVLTTASGKLALIECTTRIADFANKLGKLVDRRGALSKSLMESGHSTTVTAILICRLPRNQISAQREDLHAHGTILMSREDLVAAFERLRHPTDPDGFLDELLAKLDDSEKLKLG